MLAVIFGLVVVLCLALLFQMMGFAEGYTNNTTKYADGERSFDPLLKEIHFFAAKPKTAGTASDNGNANQATSSVAYLTATEAKDLEDKLKNGSRTIDQTRSRLKGIVGDYDYNRFIGEIYKAMPDTPDTDRTTLLPFVGFLYNTGNISKAKLDEIHQYIWADPQTKTKAEIEALYNTIPMYSKLEDIYNILEYFKLKDYITETFAAELFAMLYKRSDEMGIDLVKDKLKMGGAGLYQQRITQMNADNATKSANNTAYNADVSDVKYHDDPSKLSDPQRDVMIRGPDGKMIKWSDAVKIDARYNNSGYSRYSPTNYVPEYEDSVFLSRFSSYTVNAPVVDYGFGLGPDKSGFCKASESNPSETETQCNKLDANTCAATSCCALLGGTKCVAGDESGPINKSNYSDISVTERDYYYFQGKCYGNCP
jgi:hypothetical protein